ncbi:spermidine synthase [archaeon]|nr:MAG: spermidine synthase [archaeon]RLG65339.1 MAG: spermidine synthase [archaeon]
MMQDYIDRGTEYYIKLSRIVQEFWVAFHVKDLYTTTSPYQLIKIMESPILGRILELNGEVQLSTMDEFMYHEPLVHGPMIACENPRKVLIIGGGDGGALREALKYPSVKEVHLVDIDEKVIETCKKFIPEVSKGAFDDDRVTVHIMDGKKFINETDEKFDVTIVDLPDPDSPAAAPLYVKEFFERISEITTGAGSTQAMVAWPITDYFAKVYAIIKQCFKIVRPYTATIPSFGSIWGFHYFSNKHDPHKLTLEEIRKRLSQIETKQLNEYIYIAMFHIPKWLEKRIKKLSVKEA